MRVFALAHQGEGLGRSPNRFARFFRKSGALPFILLAVNLTACKTELLDPLEHFILAPTPSPLLVDVNFCTDPAVQQKFAVKTLIIFDHSGSNKQNYQMAPDNSGAPLVVGGNLNVSVNYATDPTGMLRYGSVTSPGTLLNFLSTTPANDPLNPSRYFALIDFDNPNSATTYPANSNGFTSNVAAFYNYVQNDADGGTIGGNPVDNGSTSYLDALNKAYNIINFDMQTAINCAALPITNAPSTTCPSPGVQVASSYVIVFMSDGAPVINISGITQNPDGSISENSPGSLQLTYEPTDQILGQVQTIMGLTANTKYVAGVNLFTIYYYNPTNNIDGVGQSLLAQMAKVGNGLAYNAVSGSKLDYARFVPPSKLIKYTLSDVFVTNNSTAWDTDGILKIDSDGDGLPDVVELAAGSNPNVADTDGNGVSDLVEYRLANGTPCTVFNGSHQCIQAAFDYSAAGQACHGVSSSIVAGKRVYTSSDPNGLNDCEKILLGDVGGINNPDSNADLVPDWLEFKGGVPFQIGASSAASSFADGYTAYDKIKYGLPTNIPLTQVLNYTPSHYSLVQTSSTAMQDCYQLEVSDMVFIGTGNRVRVDVIEKSELLQDKYIYHTASKVFPASSKLIFNDWNNAAEITAGTWKAWP